MIIYTRGYLTYIKYVDNILICIHKNDINYNYNNVNELHGRLKFMWEISPENKLIFFDLHITLNYENVITNWYEKQTWSSRYSKHFSHQPMSCKRSVVTVLFDRVIITIIIRTFFLMRTLKIYLIKCRVLILTIQSFNSNHSGLTYLFTARIILISKM